MEYVDQYRDGRTARRLASAISSLVTRPWTIMEVCGGQTHTIMRFGIDELLPPQVTLIHGPGCPVCVTPVEVIDAAVEAASRPGVIFCSFGDMLRVPGSKGTLLEAKARGADVRVVYSPLDALALARRHAGTMVVFFAIGFETTAPASATVAFRARREGIENFSLLVSHMLVPPAMEAILAQGDGRVHGFLAAGHVCTVTGYAAYHGLAHRYGVPIVVTGFEPVDILQGALLCLRQLEEGRAEVENQYARSVRREGNRKAVEMVREVFEVASVKWRGMGVIPASGLALRGPYRTLDAGQRLGLDLAERGEEERCMAGKVLQGVLKPPQCPSFAKECTPSSPLGAPMVSAEGACSAYYRYRRQGLGRVGSALGETRKSGRRR